MNAMLWANRFPYALPSCPPVRTRFLRRVALATGSNGQTMQARLHRYLAVSQCARGPPRHPSDNRTVNGERSSVEHTFSLSR